jgi:hypothetical protein
MPSHVSTKLDGGTPQKSALTAVINSQRTRRFNKIVCRAEETVSARAFERRAGSSVCCEASNCETLGSTSTALNPPPSGIGSSGKKLLLLLRNFQR